MMIRLWLSIFWPPCMFVFILYWTDRSDWFPHAICNINKSTISGTKHCVN